MNRRPTSCRAIPFLCLPPPPKRSSGSGRLTLHEHSKQKLLQAVTDLATLVLPGATDASVSLLVDGKPSTAVFTGQLALDLDERQYERGYGPCLNAAITGELTEITDTETETRWADYVRLAAVRGCRSHLSVPLPVGDRVTAALNLYAREPNGFDEQSRAIALRFAPYASVALASMYAYQDARTMADNLETALQSRAVIDQAKGILMERYKLTADQAFQMLAQASMKGNTKLRTIAENLSRPGSSACAEGAGRTIRRHGCLRPGRSGEGLRVLMVEASAPVTVGGPEGLGDIMGQVARALRHERGDVEATLQTIASAAVHAVPGAEDGGISHVIARKKVESRAWTGDLAHDADRLQNHVGEGPCLDGVWTDQIVRIDDMTSEARWPRFAAAAVRLGAASSLSFQLFVERDRLGALNLYSRSARAFGEESEDIGRVFASHAAVALSGAQTEDNLRRAMNTRDMIGQAKGILMERYKLTANQAFQTLARASMQANRKITDVAEELCETGSMPG